MLVATVAITALLGVVVVDAWGDWQQHRELRNDSATGELGGEASLPLYVSAQQERRLTASYLARPTTAAKRQLDTQRAATDKGLASFRHLSGTELEKERRHKWKYVERVYKKLDGLPENRRAVDSRTGTADEATGYYTELVATMVQFYQALSSMDDAQLTQETRPLVGLFWASEALSQQDSLVAQAQAEGRMTAEHRSAFAEAYGSQRVMYKRWIAPYLPQRDSKTYERIVSSDSWRAVQRIENDLISAPTNGGTIEELPPSVERWDSAYGQVAQQMAGLNLSRTQGLLANGYERADEVRAQVAIKLGISLAIVIILAALIIGIIRTVIRSTGQVRNSARNVAQVVLPTIVGDLQHGRPADRSSLPEEVPVKDEFDELRNAVSVLARQAADAAETVYDERKGFAAFTEGVSTRAVIILGRTLLRQLDQLQERYGDDPELLAQFYELDHQLVRVRRLLENLQVLSGGQLDHPHDRPVHVANLLMDAAGESAGFKRVIKDFRAEAWVAPEVAGELTHLLAELIDNAATFSPEPYEITVRSVEASAGVAIEVEDRGYPLGAEHLGELSARLTRLPLYGALAPHQLGLFVVGHLAQRLGVNVTLDESRYRGVLATVLVPYALLTAEPEQLAPAPATPARQRQHHAPLPDETTVSGLVKRRPQRAAPPSLTASPPLPLPEQQPAVPAAAQPQQRAALGPTGVSVSGLPQRNPGKHLVEELRNDTAWSSTVQQAIDTRPLEEIENVFSALDDIKNDTP